MKKSTFVEGTLIASSAIILTKILGIIYVIPFYAFVGEQGGFLYVNLSNIYHFLFSNLFANYYIGGIEGGNTISDFSLVIKVMSFCLLIMPFLSILRGYLQGHKIIAPSSMSQVIEQVVRVFVIVLGSYLAINIFNTSIPVGVAFALSGTFLGGFVAYLYLRFKVNKNKDCFEEVKKKDEVTNKSIAKKIVTYAIPIIIASIINNLYDFVDIKLIIEGLYLIGYSASDAELISSIICTWGLKICMIIAAVAMGSNTSLLPHMVSYFTKKDYKKSNEVFNQALSTILVITIPMALGISLLADKIYFVFYGNSYYGPLILAYLALEFIFLVVLLVLNATLQSMKKFRLIYVNTLVGWGLNALLDIPLILLFNKIGIYPFYGTITATMIGCSISSIIILSCLKKEFDFKYKHVLTNLRKVIIPNIAMIVLLFSFNRILPVSENVFITIGYLAIEVISGAFIFLFIAYKNGILFDIFGKDLINKILRKLRIIK